MKQLLLITFFILNSLFNIAFASGPTLPQTGQIKCYNTTGVEISCTSTGQDGDWQTGFPWPEPRFVDNTDGTVTDKLTGLVWLKNANCTDTVGGISKASGAINWNNALTWSNNLASGYCGLTDGSTVGQWRLPNIYELRSLLNFQQSEISDWLNTQGFNNVQRKTYWSSTTHINSPTDAWFIGMTLGSIEARSCDRYDCYTKTNANRYTWTVRDSVNIGAIQLPKTGQTISYAAGDDGALQKGNNWPSPRFVDNGDQTITDALSNLIWSKDGNAPGPSVCGAATTKTWQDALDYVACLNGNNYLGKTDWRLPNINEIISLFNYGNLDTVSWLSSHGFYNVKTDFYLSSSTHTSYLNNSLYIYTGVGYVSARLKTSSFSIMPVRGGNPSIDSLIIYGKFMKFENQNIGTASSSKEISLYNSGKHSQTIASITLTGTNANQFSITPGGATPCTSLTPTLAAGGKCTMSLSFAPTNIGDKNANLTVASNGKTLDIPVTGTGIATISGTVYNLTLGNALAGATVSITGGATTTSDANGNYKFLPEPTPGSYSVTVGKLGYTGYTITNVTTTSASGAVANFYLASTGSLNFVSTTSLTGAESGVPYSNHLKITGGTGPYSFAILPGFGDLPPSLMLDSTSGVINGTPTTGGSYTFWAGCMDSLGIVTEKEFTINVSTPLSITTPAPLANISASLPYSLTLGATGGTAPYTFAKTSGTLPTGLTLSSAGVLSGTPTSVAPYSFAVTVTDAFGRTSTRFFSITIETPLVISTSHLNDGILGTAYNLQLTATGNIGSTSWNLASGSLPTGLQLNGASGIISGTPSTIETQSISISVQDAGGRTSSKQYIIKTGNPLQITTTTMPTGYLTLAYSSPVQSSGGIAPITYSLTSGTLPAGLVLNTSTGLISGTPTSGGVLANITVTATDSSYPTPQSVQQALSIRVLSALPQYTVTLSLLDGSSPASVNGSMNCTIGTTCQPAQFNLGTTVTLTAVSDPTTLFTGWSGACTGTATTCSFYVDAAKSVTATFVVRPKYNLTLLFAGDGNGQVNGDMTCTSGGACAPKQFLLGTAVLLLPTPDVNSLFDGWSGACAGLGNCSVTMDAAKSVTATFASGQPVKVKENSKTFSSLQAAYNDLTTVTGNTIMGRSVLFTETLTLDRPIDVTIRGGYDTAFATNADITAIKGQVIIRSGSLIADKLTIW